MAAIYVRDFRQFKRFPIVPQFTLQELMIVTTLVGVVLSAIASMACLRASG
jgi:prepilin-type N-terminal cleavage/methylation domain-containing protein